MDINLSCKNINVDAHWSKTLSVDLIEVDESELMYLLTIDQVIRHFGESDLLDAIGKDECMNYLGLD